MKIEAKQREELKQKIESIVMQWLWKEGMTSEVIAEKILQEIEEEKNG